MKGGPEALGSLMAAALSEASRGIADDAKRVMMALHTATTRPDTQRDYALCPPGSPAGSAARLAGRRLRGGTRLRYRRGEWARVYVVRVMDPQYPGGGVDRPWLVWAPGTSTELPHIIGRYPDQAIAMRFAHGLAGRLYSGGGLPRAVQ